MADGDEAKTTHAGETAGPLAFSSAAPSANPGQEKVLALNGTTSSEDKRSTSSSYLISSNFALSVEVEVADQEGTSSSTSSEKQKEIAGQHLGIARFHRAAHAHNICFGRLPSRACCQILD